MKETVESLLEIQSKLSKELSEVGKKIAKATHKDRLKKNSLYIGKYFRENDCGTPHYHSLISVYGIDKKTCNLHALSIRYWDNLPDSYYSCEHYFSFDPNSDYSESSERYTEITKKEFIKHFMEVNQRIKNALSK